MATNYREPTLEEVVVVAVCCNVPGVTDARLTPADQTLLGDLSRRGILVDRWQLKRWRAAGLLPTPERVAGGRGSGRRSMRYPDGAVDHAARIASLTSEGWTLALIPLVLFARHQPVTEEVLKASYRTLLTSFGHAAGLVDGDNAEDRADKIAQHMFRRAKRNDMARAGSDAPAFTERERTHRFWTR